MCIRDRNRTSVTDAGLENLRGHPGLSHLDLRETKVTGSCVPAIVSGQLEIKLFMSKTQVTDATAPNFVALTKIPAVRLDMSDTAITDEALVHLGKISTLVKLRLAGTNVTDDGLMHLTNLKSLATLDISETKCTPEGISKLESALPKLDVAWFK